MKQQGSIIGYVVVGTVLTLALVGGVLIVKNSHNSSARQVASTTATDAKKKESTQSSKSANDKLVDSLNNKSTETSKTPHRPQLIVIARRAAHRARLRKANRLSLLNLNPQTHLLQHHRPTPTPLRRPNLPSK